jgi:hypothetical protein
MLVMPPKKPVTVAHKSTRVAMRSAVPISGSQNTGLPSKSANTVVGSPKQSAKRSSHVANSSKVSRIKPSRQKNRIASSPKYLIRLRTRNRKNCCDPLRLRRSMNNLFLRTRLVKFIGTPYLPIKVGRVQDI